MVYQGSKRRIAKDLRPIIEDKINWLQQRNLGLVNYVEPFVGGANMIDKIRWPNKYGFDICEPLIALHKKNQEAPLPFLEYNREIWTKYRDSWKNGGTEYEMWEYGYFGFLVSFSSLFFNSYGELKDTSRTSKVRTNHANITKQRENDEYMNIKFGHADYKQLLLYNSVVYCDPPYKGTFKYNANKNFDHNDFWEWVRKMSLKGLGNIVLVSEFEAPEDFVCIWEKEVHHDLGNAEKKNRVEKLFMHKDSIYFVGSDNEKI